MGLIVTAKKSGRGMIRPFGTYSNEQAGAKLYIGDHELTVSTGGRVNIPKKLMDQGIKGNDGRMRLEIAFRTSAGDDDYWMHVEGKISKPFPENADKETGEKATTREIRDKYETSGEMIEALEAGIEAGEITPSEIGEKNWSP